MTFLFTTLEESWHLLRDASLYMLVGILVGGLLKVFLSPASIARHLGCGRFSSVFKAALFGIPLPLCSCGVLPAAAALKKQGANNGATTAFLISTPESGIDSISITYALLDPIMTIARPVSAFLTALVAGISENLVNPPEKHWLQADLTCPVDQCCTGENCPPQEHAGHHTLREKMSAGLRYAFGELWGDLATWFLTGILVAGLITAAVPDDLMAAYLGGGLVTMLLMLAVGIPLYICASASTPIAAALILKGVSPGAALVFMLAGPATNMAALSVLIGLLGRRATVLYLSAIAVMSVLCGLALDGIYHALGVSAQAEAGQAAELFPAWLQTGGALVILGISAKPVARAVKRLWCKKTAGRHHDHHDDNGHGACGCGGPCKPESLSPFPKAD